MSPQGHAEAHGPLAGIVVVAVEQAVAAPFATRQLADLGAEVIKVERTGDGDFARGYDATVRGQSSHFVWLNRGKQLDHPRRQVRRGTPHAGRARRARRRRRPEPGARRGPASRDRRAHPRRRAPPAGRVRCLRLRRRRPVLRPQGLRPAHPVRRRARLDHRDPGRTGEGRHLHRRHRGRDVRLHRHPHRPLRPRADRPRTGARGVDARGARRVDGLPGALRRATAARPPAGPAPRTRPSRPTAPSPRRRGT